MKITILGTGVVGRTLASRFAALGHDIVLTARNLEGEKMAEARRAVPSAAVLPAAQAAADADAIVLATQYPDAAAALAGLGDIAGKIVIDTTNPLKPDLSGLSIGHDTSAGEELQRAFPAARIVKAFNTTGFNIMAAPPQGALMLVAGNDADARGTVLELARAIGFDARDAGSIERSRLLEPLAMLWITLAYRQGFGRDYAFGVLAAG
jgi:predicted dinucleotide-binding enzyme